MSGRGVALLGASSIIKTPPQQLSEHAIVCPVRAWRGGDLLTPSASNGVCVCFFHWAMPLIDCFGGLMGVAGGDV